MRALSGVGMVFRGVRLCAGCWINLGFAHGRLPIVGPRLRWTKSLTSVCSDSGMALRLIGNALMGTKSGLPEMISRYYSISLQTERTFEESCACAKYIKGMPLEKGLLLL